MSGYFQVDSKGTPANIDISSFSPKMHCVYKATREYLESSSLSTSINTHGSFFGLLVDSTPLKGCCVSLFPEKRVV